MIEDKIKIWPAKLGIAVAVITIFPWDYGIYIVGKFFIFVVAIYYCYNNYQKEKGKQNQYFWYFLIATILYNPFVPVHLFYRMVWIIFDVAFIFIFARYIKDLNKIVPLIISDSLFCAKCGKKNNSKYHYCLNCGGKLNN